MKQFDIFLCILDPVKGSKQGGSRPCILLQSNAMNATASTFLVAPLTTRKVDRLYAGHILVEASKQNGLSEKSKIKLDQVRVLDHLRFGKKIGVLDPLYRDPVFEALDAVFDHNQDFTNV